MSSPAERHARKVERIVRALRERPPGRPLTLRKRTVSHQVPRGRDLRHTDDKIDVSDLDEVIAIDPEARTCVAEPGVTFSDLVDATLAHGLVPIVVPELATITIGGAVAGCSLESMSFRYGGFHDGCLEYEVITGRGEVLRCEPEGENGLVFQMIHGSYGTLGILSRLTFRLVPAKPFVHIEYERHATLEGYQAAIRRRYEAGEVDFMDGIIHSPALHVLSLGRFTDEAPYASRYDWMKIYYQSTADRSEDYLTTRDYFFRYDNGVTNPFLKSKLSRLLLGRFVHSTQVLRAAEKMRFLLNLKRPRVTVDLFIPSSGLEDFMSWYEREVGHFPLWCVPYKKVRDYEWIADGFFDGIDDDLFIDIAIYGAHQPRGRNLYAEIESKLLEVRGLKTLISHNFYEEDVFWTIYDRPRYEAAKRITDPDGVFRSLYDKTCLASRGIS